MLRNRRLHLAPLLLSLAAAPLHAWGVKGHAWVNQNALELLPAGELRAALLARQDEVLTSALIPDFQWKDGAIARMEGPEHYIDLEAIDPRPRPAHLPRTRLEAARLYTRLGLSYRQGGFLPWRIEEFYWALANACKTEPASVPFWAGTLGHYVADAAQPLHTTIHFDGRADRVLEGRKHLQGVHADYEIVFVEDQAIEFRRSSLEIAAPAARIADPFAAAREVIFESFAQVDTLYAVFERHRGEDRYRHWERELGGLTRRQLARASTLLASLWWSAWQEAGRPTLQAPGE